MSDGPRGPEEQLNVYDREARVVGAAPRRAAKASGRAVGAINVLLADPAGRVLLQLRPRDKENGGLWDKSVGGHVSAGESFDETVVREAGEELFDDGGTSRVRLLPGLGTVTLEEIPAGTDVALRALGRQLNLRDVRRLPDGGRKNVLYHLAIYAGRTRLAVEGFRPQASEIAGLRYATFAEVDDLLLRGELAPNMAFLWLAYGHALADAAS